MVGMRYVFLDGPECNRDCLNWKPQIIFLMQRLSSRKLQSASA